MRFITRLTLGIRRLGPVNRVLFWGFVVSLVLSIISLITAYIYYKDSASKQDLLDLQAETIRLEQWKQIPITDLTLGFSLDPQVLQEDRRISYRTPLIRIEVGVNRQPLVLLPSIDINELERDGKLDWEQEVQLRVRVGQHLPMFPKMVGDLIGHELKVRESDTRPWTAIKKIHLFHRYTATTPFLVLKETGHEYAGAYYLRVWYPGAGKTSRDGNMRDYSPFIVTPDLFKGTFEY